ncbi:MAG: endonuclease III, partial [Ignavibacteriales bacterium]|nr:endonuclease III [Ignavibacteriales bacterium]
FRKYKTANDYATANLKELEQDIHSTGFYKNKAKNIIACCRTLVEKYKGKVPSTMEELVELAGVGRKTANCVLGGAYGINSGVVVDTHVKRLSNRLGLTKEQDPVKIEADLIKQLPQKEWFSFGNLLIWHGRNVCDARKPKCSECVLNKFCPSAGEFIQRGSQ